MMKCFRRPYWRTFTTWLVALFTFTMVSNAFPQFALAEPLPNQDDSQSSKLQVSIFFTAGHIETLAQDLISQPDKHFLEKQSQAPRTPPKEGPSCLNCHDQEPPLPTLTTNPNLPLSPQEKLTQLIQNMTNLKIQVEEYLALNIPIEIQAKILEQYLNSLTLYMTASLMNHLFENPFDQLDSEFSLTLSLEKIDQMKAYLAEALRTQENSQNHRIEGRSEELKDFISVLFDFKDTRMIFTDSFKINIELFSYLKNQNEDSWLNILKLQTTKYLATQLLDITNYWPKASFQNKAFFDQLGHYFKSIDHNFGSVLEQKERATQVAFNSFLKRHLNTQTIPTIITELRYHDLISHAPQMTEIMEGSQFEKYMTKMQYIQKEQSYTLKELNKTLDTYPYSLMSQNPQSLARFIRNTILEIKKKFFHTHLLYHFIRQGEIDQAVALDLEQTYVNQYEQELSENLILSWLSPFHFPTAEVQSSARFLDLFMNEIPGITSLIKDIDTQIEAIDMNETRYHLYISDRFPPLPSIKNDPINFSILLSTLIAPITGDLFLLRKIEKLSSAKTKEELIHVYQECFSELQTKIDTPRPEIGSGHTIVDPLNMPIPVYLKAPHEEEALHEKESLEQSMVQLKTMGEKLNRLDPQNNETLDEFFKTPLEKKEFLQVKRDAFINRDRLLLIPVDKNKTILLDRYQALQNQDGLLSSEVRDTLRKGFYHISDLYDNARAENKFPIPQLFNEADYDTDKYYAAWAEKLKTVFSDLTPQQRGDALEQNTEILKELRYLEHQIKSSYLSHMSRTVHMDQVAYAHPEYFINARESFIPPDFIEKFKRIEELRKLRKTVYLDKGGEQLDAWMKNYLNIFHVRHALIQQDLIIRNNIYKVVTAKKPDEIKSYILDPFILQKTLTLVQENDPTQTWRIARYRQMHADLSHELNHGLMDAYFDSSVHSVGFWGLLALSFVIGGGIPAYVIGVALLADFTYESGHTLYGDFVTLPKSLEEQKNFFLSQSQQDEAGPGNYSDLKAFEDSLFWKKVIDTGLSAIFLLPWARSEIKRGIRLFGSEKKAAIEILTGLPTISPELEKYLKN